MIASEIFDIIGSVMGNAASASSAADQRAALDSVRSKNKIASALGQAENIYREKANEGLPGYEALTEQTKSMLPQTLNQMRDSISSGNIMGLLNQLYTSQNNSLNQLGIANEQAKSANANRYAEFLARDKTLAETVKMNNDMNFGLAQIGMDRQYAQDKLNYNQDILSSAGNLLGSDVSGLVAGLLGKSEAGTPMMPITGNKVTPSYGKDTTAYVNGLLGINNYGL